MADPRRWRCRHCASREFAPMMAASKRGEPCVRERIDVCAGVSFGETMCAEGPASAVMVRVRKREQTDRPSLRVLSSITERHVQRHVNRASPFSRHDRDFAGSIGTASGCASVTSLSRRERDRSRGTAWSPAAGRRPSARPSALATFPQTARAFDGERRRRRRRRELAAGAVPSFA